MDSQTLLRDYSKALDQLSEALKGPATSDVYKAGCIQFFEFTFELAWKTVKRMAQDAGLADCQSPKAALKAAFANGWLDNEELWLDMLSARNTMAHTYQAADAMEIFGQLPAYAEALRALLVNLHAVLES